MMHPEMQASVNTNCVFILKLAGINPLIMIEILRTRNILAELHRFEQLFSEKCIAVHAFLFILLPVVVDASLYYPALVHDWII